MKNRLPPSLTPFEKLALQWVEKGRVRDVEFSGATYQVLVADPITKEEVWAFLQLDEKNHLKDSFCPCSDHERGEGCIHRAAGWIYIFHGTALPLHRRFEKSLWNVLCRYGADAYGYDLASVKREKGEYLVSSEKGQAVLSVRGKSAAGKADLEEIFSERGETEETSLKFSGLSPDEIALWKQGNPTATLLYTLSFWSELAKWLMRLQESDASYQLKFTEQANGLPTELTVVFSAVSVTWALTPELVRDLIPSLQQIESPLKVISAKGSKQIKLRYDALQGIFAMEPESASSQKKRGLPAGAVPVDARWDYVPHKGFVEKDPFESASGALLSDVETMLNEYSSLLSACLIDTEVHRDTEKRLSYALSFDPSWKLHVAPYVFKPGDLSVPQARVFKSWVYLPNRGFYPLEEGQPLATIIPEEEVVDFILDNRSWINHYPAFRVHMTSVRTEMGYSIDETGALTFLPHLIAGGEDQKVKDFGRLVYVEGDGFFTKETSYDFLKLHPYRKIPREQVAAFIREQCEELVEIPSFFTDHSPYEKIGLQVSLRDDHTIDLIPVCELFDKYKKSALREYDEFVYLPGEGFYEIPPTVRLPEAYRAPKVIQGQAIVNFLNLELPKLKRLIVSFDEQLKVPTRSRIVLQQISQSELLGTYQLKGICRTDVGEVPLSSIWWALHRHQHQFFSPAGFLDLTDKRWGWLKDIPKTSVDRRSQELTLNGWQLLRLNAMETLTIDEEGRESPIRSHPLFSALLDFKTPHEPDIRGLTSTLRAYQMMGLKWLWFLYCHTLSGLLCDDMGLGKTHQAMGLMAAVKNQRKELGQKAKFLVICPTSVLYHWQEKLKEFLPDMQVVTYYGAQRATTDLNGTFDILLTSYGIWRNDVEILGKLVFDVAFVDELHIAKNQSTRVYSSLLQVQARIHIGMTGTPIENRLRELKALFDLMMPSYLPSEHDFNAFFIKPIEKEGNLEAKQLLSRLIRPFVLRRKKEDVLLDLPEKIEEISHCALVPDQRKLYCDLLIGSRDRLIEELQDESAPIPYIHIFGLLSQLKQVCNHPAAFMKKPEDYELYTSGKWDLFVELLEEARESQQKVVVFSHYLAMLDIIEYHLNKKRIGFAGIRGATINRGEQLQKFANDPNCEVFVASLQAAGLGIDLTAASVVIHYDRWWNQARENQATDRVHRIGQKRGVQVFKLVTKGTIEEHIDALIAKKGRLMEEIVGVDDQEVIKTLDRHEIIQLLQLLPE